MPHRLEIEFTNNTLVMTENGVERLTDILHRPVENCLWAIKWCFKGYPNGISFHKSHKHAKDFADVQIDSQPAGPARLVNVSDNIYQCVQKHGYCWTNLLEFEEAQTYKEDTWKH
jgi:hypothetical protein